MHENKLIKSHEYAPISCGCLGKSDEYIVSDRCGVDEIELQLIFLHLGDCALPEEGLAFTWHRTLTLDPR